MANISLLEFNHNESPPSNDIDLLKWAKEFRLYVSSGEKRFLPPGLTLRHYRHHSAPDPLSKLGNGE